MAELHLRLRELRKKKELSQAEKKLMQTRTASAFAYFPRISIISNAPSLNP